MLKEYYESRIYIKDCGMPKWDELDGEYLLSLENSYGFASYRCAKAIEDMINEFKSILSKLGEKLKVGDIIRKSNKS